MGNLSRYIINIQNKTESRFADYVRTISELGKYEYMLRAIVNVYHSEVDLNKAYKIFFKFLSECDIYNIELTLYIMLCDGVMYNKAICEQLINMYTFLFNIPNAFKSSIKEKILDMRGMCTIGENYIDIGKMLPDKNYLSDSFNTEFNIENEVLKIKDKRLKFIKESNGSDKKVIYDNKCIGYTDVISIYDKTLTYLLINKKNVDFRQVTYSKEHGYTYSVLEKSDIQNYNFGKVLFV